jgi:hypothetical protein
MCIFLYNKEVSCEHYDLLVLCGIILNVCSRSKLAKK